MGIVERKGKKDFRRPKPPSKQSDGRNYGGRKKSAVESDLARGRALAAAAKEKREGNRALAKAREEKETALAKKGKTKAADSDEEEEEDQPEVEEPAETVLDDQNPDGDEDEDEGNASSTPKGRVPGKAKGGPGKKGKVFASTTDMLSIINSINSSEETKIVRKLEKRVRPTAFPISHLYSTPRRKLSTLYWMKRKRRRRKRKSKRRNCCRTRRPKFWSRRKRRRFPRGKYHRMRILKRQRPKNACNSRK
ncbi:hypothetical protein BC830DRAFT_1087680 [Chytriomyces sp. MP71]|nr:hypothetical protein BC830DRAFT_1087680 [Chytriomyces sp. MP71]